MDDTSQSLLERLRFRPRSDDWRRLVELYEPWIRHWLVRRNVNEQDAEDITQDVLTVLAQQLPQFDYDPGRGKFRSWLRTITVNRLHAFWKSRRRQPIAASDLQFTEALNQLADPHSGLSQQWDREHDCHVVRRTLAAIKPEFTATTWQVFLRVAIDGRSAASVAAELGLTRNAVYIVQSRVLSRLRQELQGLCS